MSGLDDKQDELEKLKKERDTETKLLNEFIEKHALIIVKIESRILFLEVEIEVIGKV